MTFNMEHDITLTLIHIYDFSIIDHSTTSNSIDAHSPVSSPHSRCDSERKPAQLDISEVSLSHDHSILSGLFTCDLPDHYLLTSADSWSLQLKIRYMSIIVQLEYHLAVIR